MMTQQDFFLPRSFDFFPVTRRVPMFRYRPYHTTYFRKALSLDEIYLSIDTVFGTGLTPVWPSCGVQHSGDSVLSVYFSSQTLVLKQTSIPYVQRKHLTYSIVYYLQQRNSSRISVRPILVDCCIKTKLRNETMVGIPCPAKSHVHTTAALLFFVVACMNGTRRSPRNTPEIV